MLVFSAPVSRELDENRVDGASGVGGAEGKDGVSGVGGAVGKSDTIKKDRE